MLILNKKKDGHVHTPFCPHGTDDQFDKYIHKAIEAKREEISFTEHFPMPQGVTSTEFYEECVLLESQVESYIMKVKEVKKKYETNIKINLGFEVDYIEGKEEEIQAMLEKYGLEIEDSILSVHFVRFDNIYYAIDYLPEFESLLNKVGSIQQVYDIYFKTLLKSIKADLGPFKPKRIGHPTLVRIFNRKYPCQYTNYELLEEIVMAIKDRAYEIDYNVAGLRKPYCQEVYPSGEMLRLLVDNNVRMTYGTDAHKSDDMMG
nr:histidinol-phosphatase HisJ [uncultured Cellulosilyticum sp.]